jgi:hypothetical protein
MFRVSLANAFAKRTLRPLMEKHQATPVPGTLTTGLGVGGTEIFSGQVAMINASGEFDISDGSAAWGLFALDSNSTIDDLNGQPSDLRPFAVWQGGPDAYFRVDDPGSNVVIGAGVFGLSAGDPVYAGSSGEISDTGTVRIGTLVEVVTASSRIVIQVELPAYEDLT